MKVPPCPNNPVGAVWIGLSAEGYRIHGTPDPDQVGKTQSHGCIRLTNWDALALSPPGEERDSYLVCRISGAVLRQ